MRRRKELRLGSLKLIVVENARCLELRQLHNLRDDVKLLRLFLLLSFWSRYWRRRRRRHRRELRLLLVKTPLLGVERLLGITKFELSARCSSRQASARLAPALLTFPGRGGSASAVSIDASNARRTPVVRTRSDGPGRSVTDTV